VHLMSSLLSLSLSLSLSVFLSVLREAYTHKRQVGFAFLVSVGSEEAGGCCCVIFDVARATGRTRNSTTGDSRPLACRHDVSHRA